MFWLMLQLGLYKACWNHQVDMENYFCSWRNMNYQTQSELDNRVLWEYQTTWKCTDDNLYTCAIPINQQRANPFRIKSQSYPYFPTLPIHEYLSMHDNTE